MKKDIFITALVSVLTFSSCSLTRYIYTASPANNPYFTDKGQSKLTAYYSSNGAESDASGHSRIDPKSRDNGADVQAAYAFGKNWAITTGYYHRNETDFNTEDSRDVTVKYKRDLYDIGGGFFIPLNKKNSFTFNIYAGAAFGKFIINDQNSIDNYERYHNASISKYYIQPSFNYIGSKYLNIGLIMKTSFVNYGNIQSNYSESEKESFGLLRIENRMVPFWEPELNMQLGLPQLQWVKIDAAISGVNSLRDDIYSKGNYRSNNASIGLSFDFSKMGKKAK